MVLHKVNNSRTLHEHVNSHNRTMSHCFPGRLTNGEIFNNRLLFENSRLLFSYCFLEIFVGGQGFDGGRGTKPPH